jgi:uncharacterized damage-inducible protein DinB
MQPGETAETAELVRLTKSALIAEMDQLAEVVRGFARELTDEQLWRKPTEPGNSVGHLMLHLTGNLSHFIGAQVGGTGYVRDREREFTEGSPPTRAELFANLDAAVATFRRVVTGLSDEQLVATHPDAKRGPVLQALMHLLAHFALHRGQISYIVRLVKPAG